MFRICNTFFKQSIFISLSQNSIANFAWQIISVGMHLATKMQMFPEENVL